MEMNETTVALGLSALSMNISFPFHIPEFASRTSFVKPSAQLGKSRRKLGAN